MEEIRTKKANIRATYLEKRRNLNEEQKNELDSLVCKRILDSSTFKSGDIILSYMPKKEEINIVPVLKEAMKQGKRIAFPLCNPENHTMSFHFVDDLKQLKPGHYGLYEPSKDLEEYDINSTEKTICIIPGIVYDKKGYRIGYGGGYYDRYLQSFKGMKLGITYYDCIVNLVPRSRFDFSVDVLITERGVYAKR